MKIRKPEFRPVPDSEYVAELRKRCQEQERELVALRAQVNGDTPTATRWLQGKVTSQRAALDALNRRVVTQRFVLRTLNELGRGLSREEYLKARDAVANESLRDRIEDPDPE